MPCLLWELANNRHQSRGEWPSSWPGVVAYSCNPATWRPDCMNGLRMGSMLVRRSCWPGVRTKAGINMGTIEESLVSRFSKEGHIGPGATCEHPKVLMPVSSWTALVSGLWLVACSIWLNNNLLQDSLPGLLMCWTSHLRLDTPVGKSMCWTSCLGLDTPVGKGKGQGHL